MIKMIAVVYRKAGMTHEEFRNYYDNHHAPLIKNIMGDDLQSYIRNYTKGPSSLSIDVPPAFDCVTEFIFQDQAAFDRAMAAVEDPKVVEMVRADELNFADVARAQMGVVEVEEQVRRLPAE